MVPTFLKEMESEIVRLEAVLREHSVYRQLEVLRASLRSLRDAYAEGQAGTGPEMIVTHLTERPRRERVGTLAQKVTRIAEETMRKTGRRQTSSEIVALLRAEGVEVQGKKPQATVASTLSANDMFDNRHDTRGSGYGLVEWLAVTPQQMRAVGIIPEHARVLGLEGQAAADADNEEQ